MIWAVVLIPVQVRQARLAAAFERGGEIPPVYWRLNRHWYFWGILATVIPLANLYVMVAKPKGSTQNKRAILRRALSLPPQGRPPAGNPDSVA